jgi:hypothetical protein
VVVFAGEQHGVFKCLHLSGEPFHLTFDVGGDVFAFLTELEQRVDVGGGRLDAIGLFYGALQALAFLQDLLGTFLVIPEIRRGDLFFDFGQLGFLSGRVKDSSARRWPARGAQRTLFPVPRWSAWCSGSERLERHFSKTGYSGFNR